MVELNQEFADLQSVDFWKKFACPPLKNNIQIKLSYYLTSVLLLTVVNDLLTDSISCFVLRKTVKDES